MTTATRTDPATASKAPSQMVDPSTLREWLKDGTATVIDVREPDEFAREHIAGATLVPLSSIDVTSLPGGHGATLVLHCRSGRRSDEAAARLAAAGRTDILQLSGGIEAWKAAGLPVEENRHIPISIMRQVQIVAGSMVVLSTVLALTVSPWLALLAGFVGAGLTFAGVSGTCGLAAVLGVMPWNRALRAPHVPAQAQKKASAGCCGGSCH